MLRSLGAQGFVRVRQGSALGRLGVWGEGSPGFGVR